MDSDKDSLERSPAQELGEYVRTKFMLAREAKVAAHSRLVECQHQLRGTVMSGEDPDPEVPINMNITSPIIRGVVGMLRDVLASAIERPWTLKPTVIPDLDENSVAEAERQLERDLPMVLAMGGGDPNAVAMYAQELKKSLMYKQMVAAATASEAMTKKVEDQLHDAGWVGAFGDFLHNFVAFPTAIMKAPSIRPRRWKRWAGDRLVWEWRNIRTVENIDPFNFFLAPNASSVDDAEYVVEMRKVSRGELAELSSVEGYIAEGIVRVLEAYPNGHVEALETSTQKGIEPEDHMHSNSGQDEGFYDCVIFYGAIPGSVLTEFGIVVGDENTSYEAEIAVVAGWTIRAVLNPDPSGRRPFYAASFEPIPGAFWGECPNTRLRPVARLCVATTKRLVRNMALASGPMFEVDTSRLSDEDNADFDTIAPFMVRSVKPDRAQGNPAHRAITIPDMTAQLSMLLDKFMGYGYEVIGIPRIAFGSQDVGTLGRTSGGVSMVMNQASKSIKFALRVLEEQVIEPVVQSFVDYELLFGDDPSVRGDIRCYARGVSGILEKEAKKDKLGWALQSLGPFMSVVNPATQQPMIPPQAVLRLLYEMFKAEGIPTDGVFPDFDFEALVQQDMQSIGSPTSIPNLDNRSAAAAGTIESMNSL